MSLSEWAVWLVVALAAALAADAATHALAAGMAAGYAVLALGACRDWRLTFRSPRPRRRGGKGEG